MKTAEIAASLAASVASAERLPGSKVRGTGAVVRQRLGDFEAPTDPSNRERADPSNSQPRERGRDVGVAVYEAAVVNAQPPLPGESAQLGIERWGQPMIPDGSDLAGVDRHARARSETFDALGGPAPHGRTWEAHLKLAALMQCRGQ